MDDRIPPKKKKPKAFPWMKDTEEFTSAQTPSSSSLSSSELDDESLSTEKDIVNEVRETLKRGISSTLVKPEQESETDRFSEDLVKEKEQESQAYVDAGKKWEEIGNYSSASVSYCCAVLAIYLAKGGAAAIRRYSEVATVAGPDTFGEPTFLAARLLVEAEMLGNPDKLQQAEERMLKVATGSYPEEKELIARALKKARRVLRQKGKI